MGMLESTKLKCAQVIDMMTEKHMGIIECLDIVGVSYHSFVKCVNQNPEMNTRYEDARKGNAHFMAQEVIKIADGDDNPHKARNRIDARKWLASKNNSAVYGDKIDVTVESKVDLSSALDAARKRAAIAVSASVVLDQSLRVSRDDDVNADVPDSSDDSEIDDMLS